MNKTLSCFSISGYFSSTEIFQLYDNDTTDKKDKSMKKNGKC